MLLVQYSRSFGIFIEGEALLDCFLVFLENDVLSHLVGKKAVEGLKNAEQWTGDLGLDIYAMGVDLNKWQLSSTGKFCGKCLDSELICKPACYLEQINGVY